MRAWLVLLLLTLSACASAPRSQAIEAAERAGMVRQDQAAGAFTLATWEKAAPARAPLFVFIEGDGKAWVSRTQPAQDPTPTDPVALRMAAQETRGAVLYVARPCQFVQTAACEARYWTSARFAPEVIATTAHVITQAQARTHAPEVIMVGYSGGGVLAALVAARMVEQTLGPVRLMTFAAPLDVAAWTTAHAVSPLTGSDLPLNHRTELAQIPQRHWVGQKDSTVPPAIVESYRHALGGPCVKTITILTFTHECCWETLAPLPLPDCP